MAKRVGRKSKAQTPAPKKERIFGSKKNPKGSASSEKSASKIRLNKEIIKGLENKLAKFKEENPNKKNVNLNDLKAVFRRGLGAYSTSHRPTITGGVPNTRNAWAFARVNKFLKKASGEKVKKAYVQDDDLMAKGGKVKSINDFLDKRFPFLSQDKLKKDDIVKLFHIDNTIQVRISIGGRVSGNAINYSISYYDQNRNEQRPIEARRVDGRVIKSMIEKEELIETNLIDGIRYYTLNFQKFDNYANGGEIPKYRFVGEQLESDEVEAYFDSDWKLIYKWDEGKGRGISNYTIYYNGDKYLLEMDFYGFDDYISRYSYIELDEPNYADGGEVNEKEKYIDEYFKRLEFNRKKLPPKLLRYWTKMASREYEKERLKQLPFRQYDVTFQIPFGAIWNETISARSFNEAKTEFRKRHGRDIQGNLDKIVSVKLIKDKKFANGGEVSIQKYDIGHGEHYIRIKYGANEIRLTNYDLYIPNEIIDKINAPKEKIYQFNSVYVSPSDRGQGIASKLLKATIDYAKEKEIFLVTLIHSQSNSTLDDTELINWLSRNGFSILYTQNKALTYAYFDGSNPDIRFAKGGEVDKKVLRERWAKKKDALENLANNISRLRKNLSQDLRDDEDKVRLTALVIKIMDETGERVGNDDSADNGHFGVTGLKKKHIKINGSNVKLKYVGKSGVEHEKEFNDSTIASALKEAMSQSPSEYVFETSDGFRIKNDRVNRYLKIFNVSAKDLRGYSANKWIINKLRSVKDREILNNDAKRKKKFNEIVKSVAEKVGHGSATLKKHYLLPSLEREFVNHGKIVDLSNIKRTYKHGGETDEVNTGVDVIHNIDADPLDELKDIPNDGEGIFAKGGNINDKVTGEITRYPSGSALITINSKYGNKNEIGFAEIEYMTIKKYFDKPEQKKFIDVLRKKGLKPTSKIRIIDLLEIVENYRGKGYASYLLQGIIEYYKEAGDKYLVLGVGQGSDAPDEHWGKKALSHKALFDFYSRFGFESILEGESYMIIDLEKVMKNMANGGGIPRYQDNLEQLLKVEGWDINYYDNNANIVPKEKATHVSIFRFEPYYDSISIKLPSKMQVTFEWLMNKINSDKIYKSFAEDFSKLLKAKGYEGLNAYPTTYGIGVFVGFGFDINKTKQDIEKLLTSLGIEYSNEYSSAGWIFRYKISKSRENLERIKQLDNKFAEGGRLKKLASGFYEGEYKGVRFQITKQQENAYGGKPMWYYELYNEALGTFGRAHDLYFTKQQAVESAKQEIDMRNDKFADGGKTKIKEANKELVEKTDTSLLLPTYTIEDVKTYVDELTREDINDILDKLNMPFNVVDELGSGANGIAWQTNRGTVLKITKSGQEAYSSYIIFKNQENFSSQAEIYNLFVVIDLEDLQKYYFIEKQLLRPVRDVVSDELLDLYRDIEMIATSDESLEQRQSEFYQLINDEDINLDDIDKEYAEQIFDLAIKVKQEAKPYGLNLYDNHSGNVGFDWMGKLYCFDCGYVEKKSFLIGGNLNNKLMLTFKDGGEITQEDKKEIYAKWRKLVNMSRSELERFYNSEEGKVAGLTPQEAEEAGIDSGRESARWIMKMKSTKVADWTPMMWKWAKKQISFISRMSGNKGKLVDENGAKTRKHLSLLIWGHNPSKKAMGGDVEEPCHVCSMSEGGYNQLPSLTEMADGKRFIYREDVFRKGGDTNTHVGSRYMILECMGEGGITDTLNLKVIQSSDGLLPNTILNRPIRNIINRGREMGETFGKTIIGNYKKGGELNPDDKKVKNYFEHKSGSAGGLLVGKRHSEGGIKAINNSTGQPLEMEGGEVVITRDAVSDPSLHTFDGKKMTQRQILSEINQNGGGVAFAEGGKTPEAGE